MFSKLILIIFILPFYQEVKSADILLLSPVASKSHAGWYNKMAMILSQHGYQVTILNTIPGVKHSNVTHRTIEQAFTWLNDMEKSIEQNPELLEKLIQPDSLFELISYYTDPTLFGCDKLLKSKETHNFMTEFKDKHFDLIISDFFCECFFGFVHYFDNPPFIIATPFYDFDIMDLFGLYNNPSYVTTYIMSSVINMSFMERVQNTLISFMGKILLNIFYLDGHHAIAKEVFGSSLPSLEEIITKSSTLVMVGYHHVVDGAKPLPPNIIPVAGLQIDDPIKPLPNDIKDFLDSAKDGAILFSMGSNFKSVLMSPSKRNMIIDVFEQLPQKVIWKLEENITDLPSNIMIKQWIPQNAILGHPNVVLFISHGGHNGILEAIHHAVPLLGVPLMLDQLYNLERLEKMGVAIMLNYAKLDRTNFLTKIKRMISDKSFQNKMKEMSSVFRDNPQSPQERFLYWVDFALKKNSNIKYLKPESVNLHWYQRTLLDVAAFCVILLLIALWSIVKCIKILFAPFNKKIKNV